MKKRTWIGAAAVVVVVITAGAIWLGAESDSTHQIGPNTASPAYIVVNTSTPVTFTSVIADSSLKKQDPKKVLLIRTDAAGTPIDIIGRMNDRGKKADATKNDHIYSIQTTMNEPGVGSALFKVAAKFKQPGNDNDTDYDWDSDLQALNAIKDKTQRHNRLVILLRRLDRYTLSDPIQVTVEPTPTIAAPTAIPSAVGLNVSTPITFKVMITDPLLVTDSVELWQTDSVGNTTLNLGHLYDDGTHGDTSAHDGTFSIVATVTVKTAEQDQFVVAARFGTQTVSTKSAAIVLSVWSIFDSSSAGYSVAYPPSLTLRAGDGEQVVGLSNSMLDHESGGIWIYTIENTSGFSLADWWDTQPYAAAGPVPMQRSVAGLPGLEITVDPDGLPETHVLVKSADKIYDILLAGIDRQTAEGVLSTLRFK